MEDRRAVVPILREEAMSTQTGYMGWVIWRKWRSGHKAWGRRRKKGKNSGRSSFAPGIFSVFFPFGRITAGTVGTVTRPLSGRRGSSVSYRQLPRGRLYCNFSPNGTEEHGLGLPADLWCSLRSGLRNTEMWFGICVLFYYNIYYINATYLPSYCRSKRFINIRSHNNRYVSIYYLIHFQQYT